MAVCVLVLLLMVPAVGFVLLALCNDDRPEVT